jgi:hypothetical protein
MTVAEILTEAGEKQDTVLREHAVLVALSKVSRYEAECNGFISKHGQGFEAFRARIEAMENEESFEAEDDLLDWEFAHRALIRWGDRAQELRRAG